jgi:aryl sulfotransferase
VRYRSPDEDSARWLEFAFREGDIVISTRSKSGTTWVQMIAALLVFQTAELPGPLGQLSPWLDWLVTPRDDVYAQLGSQEHRRIIKTHTPLDGIPLDSRATYVVVARHPLDMAVSLYHQGDNLDRDRIRQLTGFAPPPDQPARPPLREWLLAWIDGDASPQEQLDSLPGVMWHYRDAWARRLEPNVVLVHFDDLCTDLDAEMRRLAGRLGVEIDEATWPGLVDAAGFDRMRDRADQLAPDPTGVLKDRARFFRRGTSGDGPALLTSAESAHYLERTARMAPPDLLTWLHHDEAAST